MLEIKQDNTSKNPHIKTSKPLPSIFRVLGVLIILFIFLSASLLAYILINREDGFSQWVVKNTLINEVLSLGNSKRDNSSSNTNSNKPGNSLLGLNQDLSLSFANQSSPLTVVETVNKVIPSVLSISVGNSSPRQLEQVAAGTGYIVSKSGLVITNKHVIAQKCQPNSQNIKITALTNDQNALNLKLLTVDPIEDLAILQIENIPNNLVPITFTDSNNLRVGSEVIAVGNVLGELQNSVTKGIISGLNRTLDTTLMDECTGRRVTPDNLIQTDAAVNKGNSGGPLFDSSGLLVGMNTYGSSDAQNISFAISSNSIVSGLRSYEKNSTIIRPRLGITSRSITAIDKNDNAWLPVNYGEIILAPQGESAVLPDSSASEAGLSEGDIIIEVNGQKLEATNNNPSPLRRYLLSLQQGDKIEMKVIKANGTSREGYTYDSNPTTTSAVLKGVSVTLP